MPRALAAALLCLVLAACSSTCDCSSPPASVEFVGRLVSMDLDSEAPAAGGHDVAVFEVSEWRSGDRPANSDFFTVEYDQTGHLLHDGERYLVGAAPTVGGSYYSAIPTSERCDCGPTTRHADGRAIDQGVVDRWLLITPWWVIVLGGLGGALLWWLVDRGPERRRIRSAIGGTAMTLAGVAIATGIYRWPAHREVDRPVIGLAFVVAVPLLIIAGFARRRGARSEG